MHYINHNIKFFREYKRYTQSDIANMLDTTVGSVKQYEKVTFPPADMLVKIADMMGITLDTLFKIKLTSRNYNPSKKPKGEPEIYGMDKVIKLLEQIQSYQQKNKRL